MKVIEQDTEKPMLMGVNAATELTMRIRKQAIEDIRNKRKSSYGIPIRDKLQPLLRDAMIAGYLKGSHRSRLFLPKGLSLSVFDNVISVLKKQIDVDFDALQDRFDTQALKVLNDVSKNVDKKLRKVVVDLTLRGVHVQDAVEELEDHFDRLGITIKAPNQLETIFRTNLQTAYNAGRWHADQDPDIQEILWGYKYVTVGDDRVRDSHAAMDGVTLPKDHEIWDSWWPPNGWNCRCQVIPIFEEMKIVEPDDEVDPDDDFDFNPGKVFEFAFDINQARDEAGRWTSTGALGEKREELRQKKLDAHAKVKAARALVKAANNDLDKMHALDELHKANEEHKALAGEHKILRHAHMGKKRGFKVEDGDGEGLSTGKIVSTSVLGGGVNPTYIVTFENGEKGVFKPIKGEMRYYKSLREPGETLASREVGAYIIDQAMGAGLVPETVMRDIPGLGKGSLQKFKTAKEAHNGGPYDPNKPPPYGLDDLIAFDLVIGHVDRHGKNWMIDEDQRVVAIDNGYSLGPASAYIGEGMEFRLFDNVRGDRFVPISSRFKNQLKALQAQREGVTEKLLQAGVNEKVINDTFKRAAWIESKSGVEIYHDSHSKINKEI